MKKYGTPLKKITIAINEIIREYFKEHPELTA